MTIEVHQACQGALNAVNMITGQIDAMMPSYDEARAEFQSDLQDVTDTCGGAAEAAAALSLDGALLEEVYNNPIQDLAGTPRFWRELLGALSDKATLGIACLFELAGALQSESSLRTSEENLMNLQADLERARREYVGCLRKAGLQKSRRDGTVPPEL